MKFQMGIFSRLFGRRRTKRDRTIQALPVPPPRRRPQLTQAQIDEEQLIDALFETNILEPDMKMREWLKIVAGNAKMPEQKVARMLVENSKLLEKNRGREEMTLPERYSRQFFRLKKIAQGDGRKT